MRTYVVAKTLVFNGSGEALLLRRSLEDDHRAGGPDIPGGSIEVDQGEDVFAGANREVRHETGLCIGHLAMLWASTEVRYDDQGAPHKQLLRLLCAATVEGEPKVVESEEHLSGQSQFVPVDELCRELGDTSWAVAIGHAVAHNLLEPYLPGGNREAA